MSRKLCKPESIAHCIIDETSFCLTKLQFVSFDAIRAFTPRVYQLALTPHKNAVAVPAESGT
jgi:hypothetical protein